VHTYQQPPAQTQTPRVLEAQKLKDNLFMLTAEGSGGNTAVFIQSNGVTVVDTKNPGWGQPILDKIKELTPKPYAPTLKKVSSGVKNVDTIITGHSTTMTPADLNEFAAFITELVDSVGAGVKADRVWISSPKAGRARRNTRATPTRSSHGCVRISNSLLKSSVTDPLPGGGLFHRLVASTFRWKSTPLAVFRLKAEATKS
jgi:hypothetical protein